MPELKISHTFAHRYQILEHLGEGGIGSVYRAHDRWTKKDVALKVLASDSGGASAIQDLKREFQLLAQLRHPGVVEVLDFGHGEHTARPASSHPYFTMEFVQGKSLGESFPGLSDPGRAEARFKALYHLIWQLCDILEFLHLRGTVHCDLKPDNLKLTEGIFGPKILDFGLSERIGSKRGQETKGTLPYMAPEMFNQAVLDERSDLYSLGIILYELVTSGLPFPSDDPVKIVSAHLQQKPTPPSEPNPLLPSSLSQLIMRLLEKSPADRPANAARVKEMIEAGLRQDFKETTEPERSAGRPGLAHLYSGALVSREEELRRLEGILKQAVGSKGTFVLISGEQGVGKTALLQQLKTNCQLEGIVFVDSHCLENQTVAYQPLMEALRKLKPYLESRCAAHVLSELNEILNWSREDPAVRPEDQTSLHLRVTDLLTEISRSLSFAMAIENLQWADLSTLQFLEHFQTQKDKGRVFLCGSLREEELKQGTQLAKLMEGRPKEKEYHGLRVNRLDLSGTKELISSKFIKSEFAAPFFAYVHQRTAGNPFFIIQVLKYLVEKDIIFLRDSAWTADTEKLDESEVPNSVEAVLLGNLERYDQKTRDFLNTAAVIGKRFTLDLLRQLTPADEGAITETASFLTQDQLLTRGEESGGGKTYYQFANQSLQNLLYQRVGQTKRVSLHNRVARLLESTGAEEEESVFSIAFHYLEGEDFDRAYQYALRSAEKMKQRFANDEVLAYLRNAIEVAPKVHDPEEAVRRQVAALKQRADFCRGVGDLNQAERDYQTILDLVEGSGDLKTLVETYNGLGETYRLKHDYKKGISTLQKAMQIHQKLDEPLELAYTLSYMGLLYWTDSQFDKALDSFQKALEIDRKLGDKYYMASTLNNMGLVYWSRRQYHEALKRFTDCLSLHQDMDNREWIARSHNNVGATHFELGQYADSVKHFRESLRINQQIKNHKEVAFNLENLSDAYRKVGDYQSALEHGENGLKLASEIGFSERVGRILKGLGLAHLELGGYSKADKYFRQAREVAEKIVDRELKILALIGSSKLRAVLRDRKGAARLAEQAAEIIDQVGDEKSRVSLCQVKAMLCLDEGRSEQAVGLLDQAAALADKLNLGEDIFSLSLMRAELHLDLGDAARCQEFLDRARDTGLERYILLRPTFHLVSGKAEERSGDPSSAKQEYETALDLAEKLGHLDTVWQIHHRLGKLFLSEHDVEQGYQYLRSAGAIVRRLSQNIEDDELRQGYLKDPRKRELLADLRKAAKGLVGEARMA
ncbi:MAG: tetratricopeptide repeat protein [Candidatus Zixiibacteriota bacterium]|nr:MAG: tetratricopeptide repeat protein [candidate division Zixibacteria bacterium]